MPLQFVSANGSANGSIHIHFSDFFIFSLNHFSGISLDYIFIDLCQVIFDSSWRVGFPSL